MGKQWKSIRRLLTGAAVPHVPATEFKARCAESLDAVHETRRVLTVTRHGKPFVQVAPCDLQPPDPVGFMRGTVVAASDLVLADELSWDESGSDPLLGKP